MTEQNIVILAIIGIGVLAFLIYHYVEGKKQIALASLPGAVQATLQGGIAKVQTEAKSVEAQVASVIQTAEADVKKVL
jgi:hypothetical protein